MNDNNICLTNWNELPRICVPEYILHVLQNYHIIGIRFLYDAFAKKRRGSVLNISIDMNIPILISAFLATLLHVQIRDDVVIISRSDNVLKWLYHLRKDANLSDSIMLITSSESFDCDHKGTKIFIIPKDDLDILKNHPLERLFCVVVEDLESIVNKRVVQSLKGKFNIGITYKNFLMNRDPAGQYNILHWLDGDKYKRKANFVSENIEHYLNLRDPYTEDWLRLTWNFSDTFKKISPEQQKLYEQNVSDWARVNKVEYISMKSVKKTRQKNIRKKEVKPIFKETSSSEDNSGVIHETPISEASTSGGTKSITKQEFIQLPYMDERPMLNSIKKSFSLDTTNEPSYSGNCATSFLDKDLITKQEIDIKNEIVTGEDINTDEEINTDEFELHKEGSIYDSLIFTQKSVLDATNLKKKKKETDYLNSLMNDNISSYEDLLDKTVEVDTDTQTKLLASLFESN